MASAWLHACYLRLDSCRSHWKWSFLLKHVNEAFGTVNYEHALFQDNTSLDRALNITPEQIHAFDQDKGINEEIVYAILNIGMNSSAPHRLSRQHQTLSSLKIGRLCWSRWVGWGPSFL